MERVGFGLFGSPIGLDYVSNGLFKALKIEDETYLNLPNGVELSKGERIAKISRQTHSSSKIEVIKIYIYEHAISFDKRGGGFIGSAYVFIGKPTPTLLYHAVKHLHPKVFTLLDENQKFKSADFNLTEKDLINPNTAGLLDNKPRKIATPTDNSDYLVLTDGSLFNHLMSVVQGFMCNPNFRNLKCIYVSNNKNLLKRIVNNNERSILGLGHLLNFQNHFDSLNKKIQEKNQERLQLEKDIQERERKATVELENKTAALQQEINDKEKTLKQKNDQKIQLDKEIINMQEHFKRLEQENQNKEKQVSNLQNEISSLKAKKEETFSDLHNDKSSNTQEQPKADKEPKLLPVEYSLKKFLDLEEDEQKRHKDSLDTFIQQLNDKTTNISEKDKKAFFERKWNIGEFIDVEEFDKNKVLAGLNRITDIKKTYEKHDKSTEIFDTKFGISELNAKEIYKENFDFGTAARNDILKKYLNNQEGIYSKIDLPNKWYKVENFEEEAQLLYMHFRWMVYKLSKHKNDADKDLKTTKQKTHKVLLIKE